MITKEKIEEIAINCGVNVTYAEPGKGGFIIDDSGIVYKSLLEPTAQKSLLKTALAEYGYICEDIVSIFVGENSNGNEIIIVADSVATGTALRHNEFCFELYDWNEQIDNFAVYDIEEFKSMNEKYSDYEMLYQREYRK